jgi:hypothetical protein
MQVMQLPSAGARKHRGLFLVVCRVRKETEYERRRTVLKLFVGMVGATIKRWQVCTSAA